MTTIPFIDYEGKQTHFYVDPKLNETIKIWQGRLTKKDSDLLIIVDGPERAGKSTFAMQIAKAFDPTFDLDRIAFTPEEFVNLVKKVGKGQAIVFDEAYTGLASRQSMSKVNKALVSMMMEMGQKNLFCLIVMPSFFLLDKYVALFRSKCLFHVYTNKGVRGYYLGYSFAKKQLLYINGKHFMSYSQPRTRVKGRFYGKYIVDEEKYRDMKKEALNKKETEESSVEIPPRVRKAFELVEIQGNSQKKAAEILDIHPSRVGMLLVKAEKLGLYEDLPKYATSLPRTKTTFR